MDETTQAMKDEIDHLAMTVRRHREQLLADPGDLAITLRCPKALRSRLIPTAQFSGRAVTTCSTSSRIQDPA